MDPPATSTWTRIRLTFTNPARLGRLISDRQPWLDVLLLSTAVAMIGVAAMPDEVFTEPMRTAVSRRGAAVEITSPPGVVAWWGRGIGMLATLATHPVVAATIAGVMTALFHFLLRGRATFRHHFSLVSHVLLIPALGTLIASIVRVAGGGTSLTLLAARGEATTLAGAVLLGIDPFVVWMLIALGVSLHGADPGQPSLRSAALLVFGYVILAATSTALLHPELLG